MKYTIVFPLAVLITITAVLTSIVAAIHRGGTFIEQILLIAISMVMVLAVHFLPAISRRLPAWILWFGCLLCAIFGHLTFLTHSTSNASQIRVQQSVQVQSTQKQIEAVREALGTISARPVSVVAAEIGETGDWKRLVALREELKQAKRADGLRDELVRLSAVTTDAVVAGAADPVIGRIAAITGWSEAGVTISIGMLFSILLELTGAFLWFETLKRQQSQIQAVTLPVTTVTESVTTQVTHVSGDLSRLLGAIQSGQCHTTVASIRTFLNCSQQKAMTLRREIIEQKMC